jgi:uncharacterized repeat protein (TIGR03803 family)
MLPNRLSFIFVASAILALTSSVVGSPRYKVLHAFGAGKDGAGLYSGLALDRQGNVYGTTSGGGPYGYGTVFQLTPHSNGTWTEAILHSFKNNGQDGDDLNGGLILDAAGSLYGTATLGGGPYKYGTIFKLTPGFGGWTLTVLHRFGFNKYGCCPQASLVMDDAGNLFGIAGVAFELSPGADGWTETVLHDFSGQNGDGSDAYAGLILDTAGNLYGETEGGGTSTRCGGGCGTAYQLRPVSGGGWKEHILHDFGAIGDGAFPGGPLLLDSTGNLYGTTGVGGATGNGTVYRLTLESDGRWKETILHDFTGGANGIEPGGGVVMNKAGNLYGTTIGGGSPNCECGLVYKLSPGTGGKWNFKVLHTFVGTDGAQPAANLTLDDKGNLYGTTITGGAGGYGVAFQLTP